MVDSNNVPFLIIGDAPHSILAKLNNSDATTYLTDRGNRGFNALWIELLCDAYTFGYGNEGQPNYGRDVNGNNPFTSTLQGGYYDLTTPNQAYWSHVDYIVQQAAAHGLQCAFTPLDQGGWMQTLLANGASRCNTYGLFLGNRYRNSPNIIWQMGNDFGNWSYNPEADADVMAIADGIHSVDSAHLMTIQYTGIPASCSQDDDNWTPRVNINSVYTYYPTYAETYVAYNKPTVMPVLFLEENYEGENNVGQQGTPYVLRLQEYWSLTAGALAGHFYGNGWIDSFGWDWLNNLGTQGVTELGYFKSFFNGINWYDLVPDQGHTLLTAGYGTFNDNNVLIANNNYATAAMNADGSLAIIYTPVSHNMTVAMGNFSGQVRARWFDPTNNTFTTVSGSPFPNSGSHNFMTPGNNSGGDPDWVLLLQSGAGSPTPTPTPTATPTPTVVDFDSDGHPDYLLYNSGTRQTAIWYLNNNVRIGFALAPTLPAGWQVVTMADFNRDGHPDYVLFNPTTGETVIWYMNNNVHVTGAHGPTLPVGWSLAGVADFNGDGKPDYLLLNPVTLQTVIWYMNNNVHVTGAYGPTLLPGWSLAGVADFNGDGKPDYLLLNPVTLQTVIWYMNNNVHVTGAYGPTLPAGWSLIAP